MVNKRMHAARQRDACALTRALRAFHAELPLPFVILPLLPALSVYPVYDRHDSARHYGRRQHFVRRLLPPSLSLTLARERLGYDAF